MASLSFQHVELPEYPPLALNFYDIFNECLQPVSRTSVDEAAESLLQFLPQNDTRSEIVTEFFMMIREIALDIPYSHPSSIKMARIVQKVLRSPRFVDPTSLQDAENYRYQHFREKVYLIFDNTVDDDTTLNAQAFLAHFYNETFPDRPLFPIVLLRNAFEEERQEFVRAREIFAKSAAIWIWIYGGSLFSVVCDPNNENDYAWDPRERYEARLQDRSERHLTLQRWRFWIESFNDIGSGALTVNDGLQASEKCKDLCRMAAKIMQELLDSPEYEHPLM